MQENKQIDYAELCKLVGDLYISSHVSSLQSQQLLEQLTTQLTAAREEIRKLKEQWNTQTENIL